MFTTLTSRIVAGTVLALAAVGARKAYTNSRKPSGLPSPGWRKQDPKEMDELLDIGVRDSMAASDPVSVSQPDVRR